MLSVVLPVSAGDQGLRRTLRALTEVLRGRSADSWEMIVLVIGVDRDSTETVTEFATVHPQVSLIRFQPGQDAGHAVRYGVLLTRGERILLVGPDPSVPVSLLGEMENLCEAGNDLVIASESTPCTRPMPSVRIRTELAARSVQVSLRLLSIRRAMRRRILLQLYKRPAALEIFNRQRLDTGGFTVEVLYLARRYGYSVVEMAIPEPAAGIDVPQAGAARSRGRGEGTAPDGAGIGELLKIRLHRLRGHYG